jgi:hypothetical protein
MIVSPCAIELEIVYSSIPGIAVIANGRVNNLRARLIFPQVKVWTGMFTRHFMVDRHAGYRSLHLDKRAPTRGKYR